MKKVSDMKTYLTPLAAAITLSLAAGSAQALDVYLAAKPFTKTLPDMTDDAGAPVPVTVPMWGYVEDVGGLCYNAADAATRLACIGGLPDPSLPGPRISSDNTGLTIFLSNGLPEPTSVIIPGQALPISNGPGPTWNDGGTGPRASVLSRRVRSYGSEAAPGGTESYNWPSLARSGSFIYHSGTHPQKQVYMGLYGAVTQDAALGEVFAGVPYENEVVLFYSDIDPELNASIAELYNPTGSIAPYETSMGMHARYYLINGEPYDPGTTPDLGLLTNANNLVRMFSTASETVVPVLQGLYMDIHAEDGFQYNYQDAAGLANNVPRTQYSAKLPPLKTKDAIVNPDAQGRFAVYEGGGHMTNPTNPNDFNTPDNVGGMLRYLGSNGKVFFSTLGGGVNNPVPGVDGPYDDADIYAYGDGSAAYSRVLDATVVGIPGGADVDGLHVVDAQNFYVSFNNDTAVTAGGGTFEDEDVATCSTASGSLVCTPYFTGSVCGLNASNGGDIDALAIDDSLGFPLLYFSTVGNSPVQGVPAPHSNADIYAAFGANCIRVIDASAAGNGIPGNIDGLSVKGTKVYMSMAGATTTLPELGSVNDEAVVSFDFDFATGIAIPGSWTMHFSGPGLDANAGQDVDAIHVP